MDKNAVIKLAFRKACQYLREHPPADALYNDDPRTIYLLVDAKGDPAGARWMSYFIEQALKELEEE